MPADERQYWPRKPREERRLTFRWTYKEAVGYLAGTRSTLAKHGYKGTIIGSVDELGYSSHDLDIELDPLPGRRHRLIGLAKALKAELMLDYPKTMEVIINGKIVDFVIEED